MLHHRVGLLLRVVDHHIQAGDGVVLASNRLEVHRLKGGRDGGKLVGLGGRGLVALRRLSRHSGGNVTCADGGAPQRQGDGEASCATACVSDGDALQAALLLKPRQYLLHRHGVPGADVQLHLVHLIRLAVDLLPPAETLRVEVVFHRLQLVAAGHLHLLLSPFLRVGSDQGSAQRSDGHAAAKSQRCIGSACCSLDEISRGRGQRTE
mmetsp:Transcript_11886/g.21426  ORF Transcript_11886/g.21426 Transcript_11886/m.21426 type:complete len:208 (+) Transcript_11886:907-1530(+)